MNGIAAFGERLLLHELPVTRGKIELGADELGLLYEQTEGWPATLVLAGLWLRTVDDPASAPGPPE